MRDDLAVGKTLQHHGRAAPSLLQRVCSRTVERAEGRGQTEINTRLRRPVSPLVPSLPPGLLACAVFAVLFAAWQLIAAADPNLGRFLPPPSSIFAALFRPGPDGQPVIRAIPGAVAVTMTTASLALLAGLITGVSSGIAMARSQHVRLALNPYLSVINALPKIAILPILIIVLGFGTLPGLILAWMSTYVIIALNTFLGASSVDTKMVHHLRVLGATPRQIDRLVTVPAIVPWLVAAARLALGHAFSVAIISETYGVRAGLGYLLLFYSNQAYAPGEFIVLVTVSAIAIAIDRGIAMAERHVSRWREGVSLSL